MAARARLQALLPEMSAGAPRGRGRHGARKK